MTNVQRFLNETLRRLLIICHKKTYKISWVVCYSDLKFINVHKNAKPISFHGFSIFHSSEIFLFIYFVDLWFELRSKKIKFKICQSLSFLVIWQYKNNSQAFLTGFSLYYSSIKLVLQNIYLYDSTMIWQLKFYPYIIYKYSTTHMICGCLS